MKSEFESKTADRQKDDHTRRTELAMLYLLMEKYPKESKEKLPKNLNLTVTAFSDNKKALKLRKP